MAIINTYKGTEEYNGHTVLIDCEVGSRNYNINDVTSDNDRKLFVMPTFDDLYHARRTAANYSTVIDGVNFDVDVHDIRRIPELVWKANINYIEVLFSNDVFYSDSKVIKALLDTLFDDREEYARMNLKDFYNACLGMYREKMHHLQKGKHNTRDLVAKYGYCTKHACHAYRCLDILKRYHDTDFTSFAHAVRYGSDDPTRRLLIDIKGGSMNYTDFLGLIEDMEETTILTYKDAYTAMPSNKTSLNKINEIVHTIVKTGRDDCK